MFRAFLAFAGGLSFLFVQAARPQPAQTIGTALVTGRVVDGTTGKPMVGAVVTLGAGPLGPAGPYGSQPLPAAAARRGTTVTGADGRFEFRNVPFGSHSIAATLEGHAAGASGRRRPGGPSQRFTVADGARPTDLVIPVWRLASMSGMVRDDRGEPVIGVSVWAMARVVNNGREELSFAGGSSEATDDRGMFRLSNLMPGTYLVNVRFGTQTFAITTVDAHRAAVTAGSVPTPSYGTTGTLMMATEGLTIGDWQVSTAGSYPQALPGPNGTLLVHPGAFYSGARLAADAMPITLEAGDDRAGIDFTLPLVTGVRVSGVLLGPDGPAANHGVRLIPVNDRDPAFDEAVAYCTTDQAGRFALHGVVPGAYVIRAYRMPPSGPVVRVTPPAAGGLPITRAELETPTPAAHPIPSLFVQMPVTVGSSHIDGLSVSLTPGAMISGRVAFDGSAAPPPAARLQQIGLQFMPFRGPSLPAQVTRVDAEGRFQSSGLPPGRYTLAIPTPPGPEWTVSAVHVGGVDVTTDALTLSDKDLTDVVVTFTDKVQTISGTVRTISGTGDADATVILFPVDVPGWMKSGMSPRRLVVGSSTVSGAYQLKVPLPGDYLLVAIAPEVQPDVNAEFLKRYSSTAVRISIAAGESKTQALTVSKAR